MFVFKLPLKMGKQEDGLCFWVSLFSMAKQFGPLYLYSKDKSAATVIDMYANMWICMI